MTHTSTPTRRIVKAAVTTIATAIAALGGTATARAEAVFGLTTTNALVRFDSLTPTLTSATVNITGLAGTDERILGIDLRPATGTLYGLGSAGNLYTLNAGTGAATFVAALAADPADATNPFAGLLGSSFGIDFNPTVDRLRITSNAGQNLRINPLTGRVTTDTGLNGATSSISASAYTNNDIDPATGTALYGIDGATDMLYTQAPPNDGVQTAVGLLGINTSNVAGFDISGTSGIAYASLTDVDTSKSGLYTVSLTTGAATLVGEFGFGGATAYAPPLLDITVAAIPEPGSMAMLAAGLLGIGFATRRRSKR